MRMETMNLVRTHRLEPILWVEQNLNSWHYHFLLKMMGEKWSRKNILKFHKLLQSCCCQVQKNLLRKAELAWQVSRYLWRGSWNFKLIISIPLFTIIFKPKMVISRVKSLIHLSIKCVLVGGYSVQCNPYWWAHQIKSRISNSESTNFPRNIT